MSDTWTYEIDEGERFKRVIRYPIEEAIFDVLGGYDGAMEALGVSRQAVHQLVGSRPIRNRAAAIRLARATAAAGCEVPAAELMELVPWQGPSRHDPNAPGRKRKGGVPQNGTARPTSEPSAPRHGGTVSPLRAQGRKPPRGKSPSFHALRLGVATGRLAVNE